MDATAGDLNHATKELDEKIEERSMPSSPDRETLDGGFPSKENDSQGSSASSSSHEIEKLEKLDSKVIKVGEVKDGEEAYAHLPPEEREIVKRQLEIPPVKVTFITLFRYATRFDLLVIFISAMAAIIGGAILPLMTVRVSCI